MNPILHTESGPVSWEILVARANATKFVANSKNTILRSSSKEQQYNIGQGSFEEYMHLKYILQLPPSVEFTNISLVFGTSKENNAKC